MPILSKHDPLSTTPASEIVIRQRGGQEESLVDTQYGRLQFDLASDRRMNSVLMTLTPGDATSVTEWKLLDNTTVTLTYEQLRDLIEEAKLAFGFRCQYVFPIVQELLELSRTKGATMRDLESRKWY